MARARDAALARTKFVEALIDAAQTAAEAHEKVAAATRAADRADGDHAAAYKDALDAGWTAAELKDSGLNAPTTPGAKKKPSARKSTAKSARAAAPRRPADTPVALASGSTPAAAALDHTDSPPPNAQ